MFKLVEDDIRFRSYSYRDRHIVIARTKNINEIVYFNYKGYGEKSGFRINKIIKNGI